MSAPCYELHDVRKAYGGKTVLAVDHLVVHQGETLAIVGPNGAGKTTLLRVLNFLEQADQGRIWFEGSLVPYPAPLHLRRRITTVFQRTVLLHRSVRDNVAYGLGLRGEHDERRVDQVLRHVGIEHLASMPAQQLSGGEAQRLALARALALRPDVLLLDEPTANLDPPNVAAIEAIIGDLPLQDGITIVLVTHNLFQARRLADRVAMLLGGRLVEVAETARFFAGPEDPRAAAFVRGEMIY